MQINQSWKIFYQFNSVKLGIILVSYLEAVRPDLAKFCNFGKILKVFRFFLSV